MEQQVGLERNWNGRELAEPVIVSVDCVRERVSADVLCIRRGVRRPIDLCS